MHGNHEKLKLLEELKDFLAEKGGEEMQGMPMDDDDDSDMGPAGADAPSLAIAIEAPPKPPGGVEDVDALIAQGLSSSDPTLKKMAEALKKAKNPGGM